MSEEKLKNTLYDDKEAVKGFRDLLPLVFEGKVKHFSGVLDEYNRKGYDTIKQYMHKNPNSKIQMPNKSFKYQMLKTFPHPVPLPTGERE